MVNPPSISSFFEHKKTSSRIKGRGLGYRGTTLFNRQYSYVLRVRFIEITAFVPMHLYAYKSGPDANSGGELRLPGSIKMLPVIGIFSLDGHPQATFLRHRF
ncbi:hypothetical protein [Bacillus sp. ISL-45]|uniref:hypothetical protein n=1 Tax=Bacillus sp. ISL-45 TaxID=2819128 RepID=UPI001BEA29B1|nr:hypothetical protein [Bacillus sp. ISL-45]